MTADDPFRLLGIAPTATPDEVRQARRQMAKRVHPDVGGSPEAMRRVNAAAAAALVVLSEGAVVQRPASAPRSTSRTGRFSAAEVARAARRFGGQRLERDHPSFVIEALPVVACAGLTMALGQLGELIDDDPPYLLEGQLSQHVHGWCRLTIVPDAGSSTVSVDFVATPGQPAASVDEVRDVLVSELNRLDWDELSR